jgi:metal-sulfur cluster biosynthetic enzyme
MNLRGRAAWPCEYHLLPCGLVTPCTVDRHQYCLHVDHTVTVRGCLVYAVFGEAVERRMAGRLLYNELERTLSFSGT